MKGRIEKQKSPGLAAGDAETSTKRAIAIALDVFAEERHQNDAAAVTRMRDQLNLMAPIVRTSPKKWAIRDFVKILEILKDLVEATMDTKRSLSGGTDVIDIHPTTSILLEFISVLEDFENGVIDGRLRRTREAHGRSLTILDKRKIGFALAFVKMLRDDKKITLLMNNLILPTMTSYHATVKR